MRAWTRITHPSPKQRRLLRMAYSGWDPRVYSKYGHRQWAAPLPWTRVVVKDPFALLSLKAIGEVTHAHAIVVYRHPAAVLASFRRMGWSPDPAEVSAVEAMDPTQASNPTPRSSDMSADAGLVVRMWLALYRAFLLDAPAVPRLSVVSHSDLATGSSSGFHALRRVCELGAEADQRRRNRVLRLGSRSGPQLHHFDRSPDEVRDAWRERVPQREVALLEDYVEPVWRALEDLRLPVDTSPRSLP